MKKWAIIIVTQPSRARYLSRLLEIITPQVEAHDEVELVIHNFNRDKGGLGKNRLAAIELVNAEYVSFIDDDDYVSREYVSTILPLLDGVDHIGFIANGYIKGKFSFTCIHSLQCPNWSQDGDGKYLRDVTPLNPIRKELAVKGDWSGDYNCDVIWADSLRGSVKTEHYIDAPMYFYFPRGGDRNDEKDHPYMHGEFS